MCQNILCCDRGELCDAYMLMLNIQTHNMKKKPSWVLLGSESFSSVLPSLVLFAGEAFVSDLETLVEKQKHLNKVYLQCTWSTHNSQEVIVVPHFWVCRDRNTIAPAISGWQSRRPHRGPPLLHMTDVASLKPAHTCFTPGAKDVSHATQRTGVTWLNI